MRCPRLRAPRPWLGAIVASVLVFLPVITGCSKQAPTAVPLERVQSSGRAEQLAAAAPGAFYPLAIGNRWHAVADDYYRTVPAIGDPYNEIRIHTDYNRAMVGMETLFDRAYVLMREDWTQDTPFSEEPWSGTYWTRYRQDGSGLYEADVAATTPPNSLSGSAETTSQVGNAVTLQSLPALLADRIPVGELSAFRAAWQGLQARAGVVRSVLRQPVPAGTAIGPPGSLLPGEITRLRYPLRPGSTWQIRPDPLFTSSVEAVEILSLPAGRFPAYRIRVDNEALGPSDVVHVWLSRSGQLAVRYHLESDATDGQGNVIGTVVYDYNEALQEVSLLKPRWFVGVR